MAERPDLIVVEQDGSIRVAGRGASRRLADRAGRYGLVVDTPGLVVLRTVDPGEAGANGARIMMAGEILHRMSMMEIINMIATASWRGDLHIFATDETQRVIGFDQAALKHARSSSPDDRLGEILYRAGIVTRSQLDDLLREMTPDKRFGEVCVEKGVLEAQNLYRYLQMQAEQIFFNSLLVGEGTYVFAVPDESEGPSSPTLHISVQALLMEGVQRIDEMALFRDKIPSSQMCPEVKVGAPERKLETTAQTVLAYCDGQRTIEEIARSTGLGEFETTKAVYQLLQAGQVAIHSAPRVDPGAVERLVVRFNEVMQDIFVAVATYGGVAQTRATLDAWIQGSGYTPYFGAGVDEFGCIETAVVVKAVESIDHERRLESLHQALHELAAFALFSATTTLPRDQELALARDVNARLKAIRID